MGISRPSARLLMVRFSKRIIPFAALSNMASFALTLAASNWWSTLLFAKSESSESMLLAFSIELQEVMNSKKVSNA